MDRTQPTLHQRNNLLITLREQHRWTQWEVAEKCGVDVSSYQRWERGTFVPSLVHLGRLCSIFGVTVEQLGFGRHGRGRSA